MAAPYWSQSELDDYLRRRKSAGVSDASSASDIDHKVGSGSKKNPNKYNAVSIEIDGVRFDSKAEAARAQRWYIMLLAGKIAFLEFHPRYILVTNVMVNRFNLAKDVRQNELIYTADLRITHNGELAPAGLVITEDIKGMEKQRDRDIWKLWAAHGPNELRYVYKDRIVAVHNGEITRLPSDSLTGAPSGT